MRRAILATGYMAEKVESAVGSRWRDMEIAYSVEPEPLGTGGAVRNARSLLWGDAVHVVNGDTYVRYSLSGLKEAAANTGGFASVALAYVDDVSRYGAVEVGPEGRVCAFREKGGAGAGWINAGCYYLGRDALDTLPPMRPFSLETAFLVPCASAQRLGAYTETEGFIDIGVPDDFMHAQQLFRATS